MTMTEARFPRFAKFLYRSISEKSAATAWIDHPRRGFVLGDALRRDALLRGPALRVSTAFFAYDRGMFWV